MKKYQGVIYLTLKLLTVTKLWIKKKTCDTQIKTEDDDLQDNIYFLHIDGA